MPPFVFTASKTALITGGASGIGLAVAKKCLVHGMKVLIVDKNDGFLASAQRSLGEDKVSTAKADVSSLRDWAHLKKRVDSDFQDRIFASLDSAVKTIAEHLSYDLRDSSPNTSVFPEKPAAAWTPEQVADYLEAKMAKDEFYVICPDNEVTEEMDAKRVLWAVEDVVQRRSALSRWRKEYKEGFEA
ncbi:oxidoreductase [Colletotrichum cuscutae]|uniref:Oxidoreductase n=1 Tax=Colletotrichum cuscutae TaxID=1209917 RepID=A0AAI9V972_9PEZI|nr:oxidoreductase [Colletotrichum cuscutae]